MRDYIIIDGKKIEVDEKKTYRMPYVSDSGISYPEIENLDGFMSIFQEERFRNCTSEMAKVIMRQFEPYLHTKDEQGKRLFLALHSTPLFAPSNGSRPDSAELGKTYDELMNTYGLLEKIVGK